MDVKIWEVRFSYEGELVCKIVISLEMPNQAWHLLIKRKSYSGNSNLPRVNTSPSLSFALMKYMNDRKLINCMNAK